MTGNTPPPGGGGVTGRMESCQKGEAEQGEAAWGPPERLEVSSEAWLFTLTTQSLGGGGRRITHLRPA